MSENAVDQIKPVPGQSVAASLAIIAVVARMLGPTESTELGDTLWIACLLFPALTIHWLGRWYHGCRLRLDAFTVAVSLIIAGHLLSALWFWGCGLQRRAAVNVIWEWASLGAACVVLRRSTAAVRVILTMCVVLGGMGIWQYYVAFPELREEYAAHVSGSDSDMQSFLNQQELTERGIPESAAARALFADRLASLEPLGPFALANTLGGLLAVTAVFLGVLLLLSKRTPVRYVCGGLVLAPVVYCLVLTKSRTAMVGVVAAGGLLLIRQGLRLRARPVEPDSERRPIVAIGLTALIGIAVCVAVAGGGLDKEVISEAPKSMQYRLQYWQGSIDVLRESPLFGTGPGNFRQSYNVHKLAESSEEILDPHNVFLDAWCQAGLVGLVGLLWLVGCWVRSLAAAAGDETPAVDEGARWPLIAGLCGFALLFAQQWFTGQETPLLTASLAAGFAIAWWLTRAVTRDVAQGKLRLAAAIAACAMLVHLLGAGGFGMPAVMQCLLLLVCVSLPDSEDVLRVRRWVGLTPAVVGVAAFFVCLMTAVIPVQRAAWLVKSGDAKRGDAALAEYGLADRADVWDPVPIRRFGRSLLQQNRPRHALAAWTRARRRDPLGFQDERAIAWTLHAIWEQEPHDMALIQSAVKHLRASVARYPTSPRLVADLAIVEDKANDPARVESARRALQLDAINRKNGHKDRYLSTALVNQLNSVIARKNEQPANGTRPSSEVEPE